MMPTAPWSDGGDGDGDDLRWDAFIPDDDERDPEPDPGDFWIENRSRQSPCLPLSQSPCLDSRSAQCSRYRWWKRSIAC